METTKTVNIMKTEKMKCLMLECNNEVERHPFDTLNGNCNDCTRNMGKKILGVKETYFLIQDQGKDMIGWIKGLNQSGYAGCTSQGTIVDVRQFPDAIPVQPSSVFGNAKPKKVTKEQRAELLKLGVTFPLTNEELEIWDEHHKDYPYKLDSSKIDPKKILAMSKIL